MPKFQQQNKPFSEVLKESTTNASNAARSKRTDGTKADRLSEREKEVVRVDQFLLDAQRHETARLQRSISLLDSTCNLQYLINHREAVMADLSEFILDIGHWSYTITNALLASVNEEKKHGGLYEKKTKEAFEIMEGLMKISAHYDTIVSLWEEFHIKGKLIESLTDEELKTLSID